MSTSHRAYILPFLLFGSAFTRDIISPPTYAYDAQALIHGDVTVNTPGLSADVRYSKFAGLSTFANLPYVHCLAPDGVEVDKFDIAILGAGFDTVS